jgi:hypothetical protein
MMRYRNAGRRKFAVGSPQLADGSRQYQLYAHIEAERTCQQQAGNPPMAWAHALLYTMH